MQYDYFMTKKLQISSRYTEQCLYHKVLPTSPLEERNNERTYKKYRGIQYSLTLRESGYVEIKPT